MEKKCEEREVAVLENKGQKIFGVLHMPLDQSKPVPAVLICHGLAGHKTGKYRLYVTLAKMLASVGIAALRVDFRGSGDSEGEFQEMTVQSTLSDALVSMEWLAKNPRIDANRLGVFGRSFGGSVAVMTASAYQNVKSIALWAPVFNAKPWIKLWESLQAGKLDEKTKNDVMTINGQVPSLHFYKEFFDMNLEIDLEKLKTVPVLHIHGEKDELIKIEHANQYVKLREKAHAKTKFVRLPEADHDFSIAEDQHESLFITTRWFADTLLTRGERWQQFWKNLEYNSPLDFLISFNPFKRWYRREAATSANSEERKGN
jgi:hypothetical protein